MIKRTPTGINHQVPKTDKYKEKPPIKNDTKADTTAVKPPIARPPLSS